ncbi:MAG: oligosaccharide flippase family protein [Lachnospiraceae bacterium]|nr:oligosaccharide flippase family protein [Lachnospiraceae bacterium]
MGIDAVKRVKQVEDMQEKNKNRELISGTVIYAIGGFGTKILSFLFVPLYTYYILPAEMGVYDLIITTVSLLTPVVTIQIGDAAYRWLIGEEGRREDYLGVAYKLLFWHIAVIAIVLFVIEQFTEYPYVGYFFFILTGSAVFNTVQKMLRGVKNQKLFAGSGIVYTAVFLALNMIQICFMGRGMEGMLLSSAAAYWAGTFAALLGEKGVRYFPGKELFCRRQIEKEMIRFALPLIPNQLSWWVVNWSDRYIVKTFLGNEWNGIYSISYKFPTVLQSVLSLFTNSWQDVSIADKEENQGSYYSQVFDQYSVLVFSLVLMAIPISKLYVHLFMSKQYQASADYIAFLYLGSAFQSFAAYFGAGYLKSGNTRGASMTSIYGALVNIAVNLLLIHSWGLQAAAFSTFLGFLVMWIVRVKQTKKSLEISLNYKRLGIYGGTAFAYAVLACVSGTIPDIVMFIFAIMIFIFANREMIKGFGNMMKKRMKN